MKSILAVKSAGALALAFVAAFGVLPTRASSHMDAPSTVRDPAANTTDVLIVFMISSCIREKALPS